MLKDLLKENNNFCYSSAVMTVDERQSAPEVRRLAVEAYDTYKYETNRLRTYRQWPESVTTLLAEPLAREGFYYLGDKKTVQCFSCGFRSVPDIAQTKHYPNCKFKAGVSANVPLVGGSGIASNSHLLNGNLSDDSGINSNNSWDISPLSSSPSSMSSSSPSSSDESYARDVPTNSVQRNRDLLTLRQTMKDERNRLKSFYINEQSIWPVPAVSPNELARAGFYLLNDDKVQCAFCTGVIQNWVPGLRPLEEHSKHFPLCPFVMESDVGNIAIGSDPIRDPLPVLGHDVCGIRDFPIEPIAGHVISTGVRTTSPDQSIDIKTFGIQPYSGPKNPNMGPLESRMKSFVNTGWDNTIPISTNRLAEAGFYYIGYADAVKCFHCDGGLTEWAIEDDPWVEHAKNFPNCHFLKLNKSETFITDCQRLAHQSNSESNPESNTSSDDIMACRIVNDWMRSELVRQLIALNLYSIDLIKATLNSRYYSFKKPFESFAQLYEAVSHLSDNRSQTHPTNNSTVNQPIDINQTQSTQQSNNEQIHNNPNLISSSINTTSATTSSTTLPESPDESMTTFNSTTHLAQEGEPNNRSNTTAKKKGLNNGNENRLMCKICLLSEIEVVFLPCGHQLSCSKCAQRLTDCPVCRQPIKGYVRTFFS